MKAIKRDQYNGKAYLELNPKLDELIKSLVMEAAEKMRGWRSPENAVESLECKSRDGFISASENCGGYQATNFVDLAEVEGSGCWFGSQLANTVIKGQVEQAHADALTRFKEQHANELAAVPPFEGELSYHSLYECGFGSLAERLSECEHDELSGENASIMVQVRVMYGGVDERGIHRAWVSAVVNWESPYHRSAGAFYVNTGRRYATEDCKEVEVTWKTPKAAERKLRAAIKKVSKIL